MIPRETEQSCYKFDINREEKELRYCSFFLLILIVSTNPMKGPNSRQQKSLESVKLFVAFEKYPPSPPHASSAVVWETGTKVLCFFFVLILIVSANPMKGPNSRQQKSPESVKLFVIFEKYPPPPPNANSAVVWGYKNQLLYCCMLPFAIFSFPGKKTYIVSQRQTFMIYVFSSYSSWL